MVENVANVVVVYRMGMPPFPFKSRFELQVPQKSEDLVDRSPVTVEGHSLCYSFCVKEQYGNTDVQSLLRKYPTDSLPPAPNVIIIYLYYLCHDQNPCSNLVDNQISTVFRSLCTEFNGKGNEVVREPMMYRPQLSVMVIPCLKGPTGVPDLLEFAKETLALSSEVEGAPWLQQSLGLELLSIVAVHEFSSALPAIRPPGFRLYHSAVWQLGDMLQGSEMASQAKLVAPFRAVHI